MGSACLSDDDVRAFCEGRLAPARRDAAEHHATSCAICRLAIDARLATVAAVGTSTAISTASQGGEVVDHRSMASGDLQAVLPARYRLLRIVGSGGMGT